MRRVSSLPDGSPTRVVPPPISVIGLPPVFCSQRSIMMETRLPDMQRRAGAVVADIGRDRSLAEKRVKTLRVGALMNEAALMESAEEVGTEGRHACGLIEARASFGGS